MIVELPTHLAMGVRKIKYVPLNLNFYRNADFNQLNNMKILFDKLVRPKLINIPIMEKLSLSYCLYMPSKRAVDVANVCCIVDKFFSDTLKNAGKITDDNSDVISDISYHWGGVDKENPRVEVTIKEINPMKISTVVQLTHEDIVEAIKEYVVKESGIRDVHELTVNINYDDIVANVNVSNSETVKPAAPRRGRPPKAAQTQERPEIEPIPMPSEETEEIKHEPLHVDEPQEATSGAYPEVEADEPTEEATAEDASEVTQEAAVAPVAPTKGLFPSKGTSSPTPAPESKPAGKSLFNLKGLTPPSGK